jgi:hypothetical protein
LSGRCLDELVTLQVLAVLQPAALELHIAAAADVEKQQQLLHKNWQQQLERARYTAERTARQYEQVEPENRLVARELERRWEEALAELARLQQDYERFCAVQPAKLSQMQREQIRQLAQDIPQLWHAETTTPVDRQRLVRFLIERIVVTVQGQTEQVKLAIDWTGGFVSHHDLVRDVRSYEQLANYPQLLARIEELRQQGKSMDQVAECLNAEGYRPPKRVERFTGGMVSGFLSRQCEKSSKDKGDKNQPLLRKGEWLLGDLARHLGMPQETLHSWRRLGWLCARKLPEPSGRWAILASGEERRRLARLRRHQCSHPNQPIPAELTTPATPKKK